MLNTRQQLAKTAPGRPAQETKSEDPQQVGGLLTLLSGLLGSEQGGLGSGDGVSPDQQQPRSQNSAQPWKKDQRGRARNRKGLGSPEASDASPRKPSFPFQWAWESVTTDSRTLLHPHGPSMPGLQNLPPTPTAHKPQRKASLPVPSFWMSRVPSRECARQLGAWEHSLTPASAPGHKLPGKRFGPGCESEEASESEETEGGLSLQELPQLPKRGSILEESFVEATEEAKDQAGEPGPPSRRLSSSRQKGWHSGGETCEWGRSCSSGARAGEPEGVWNLEKLQEHLEQRADGSPEKQRGKASRTAAQASNRGSKVRTSAGEEPAPSTGPSTGPSNRTSHKRQEATRSLLQAWAQQQQEERRQAELRRAREQRVQQQVARCLAAYAPKGRRGPGSAQHRLEELKRQERQRFAEYKAQLQHIQHRVQARPYLFQQAMQTNARLTVTRHFSKVLSSLGLDEEQLLAKAGREEAEGSARKSR